MTAALSREYLALGESILRAMGPLSVNQVFLPPAPPDGERGDCFGVLFLSDGSAGPFYVGLGETLWLLHQRLGGGGMVDTIDGISVADLLPGLAGDDPAVRALALGAFNAISQGLMRRAGFVPPPAPRDRDPAPGERVGMVGFFGRLARPWADSGVRIRVLELVPGRIPDLPNISVARDAADLADCSRVVCTSSVLVNGTLDAIIAGIGDPSRIDLVGPSGSGLPDIPLARGIRSVGGVFFNESGALKTALNQSGHWGKAGAKYTLTRDDYPGLESLLGQHQPNPPVSTWRTHP